MSSHMDRASLETYLVHILTPVYRILDDDTIHDNLMGRLNFVSLTPLTYRSCHVGDLKTLAQELLELVQTQVGTTKFADVYNRIRQGVTTIRRERKTEKDVQVCLGAPDSCSVLRFHAGWIT